MIWEIVAKTATQLFKLSIIFTKKTNTMKKILLIPALFIFISCAKENLEPDPYEPPTESNLGYDTTAKSPYGTWQSDYYKYKLDGGAQEMSTMMRNIKMTQNSFGIDNDLDGQYETTYSLTVISDRMVTIEINDTMRRYEVNPFRDQYNVMGYQIASEKYGDVSNKKAGQVFYLNRKLK